MNYASELKKFITSQYIYSGTRIVFSVVILSIILAYLGLLERIFLISTRNLFHQRYGFYRSFSPKKKRIDSCLWVLFLCLADLYGLLKIFTAYFLENHFPGCFTMLGVYGQRLAAVGSLTLVIAIFIDGAPGGHSAFYNALVFYF